SFGWTYFLPVCSGSSVDHTASRLCAVSTTRQSMYLLASAPVLQCVGVPDMPGCVCELSVPFNWPSSDPGSPPSSRPSTSRIRLPAPPPSTILPPMPGPPPDEARLG